MATYCLLAFWLVESPSWYSTHCFKIHRAVYSMFQSATRPLQELKLDWELQLSGKSMSTLKRRANCTISLETITKYWKSHSYSCEPAFYSCTSSWKYGKPNEYKSRNERYGGANKGQMLTKVYRGWIWRISEFTNLYLKEIFAKFPRRKQLPFVKPMCLSLVSCVFVVFLQSYCSWGLLLAWRITFQDCIAEKIHSLWPRKTTYPT